MTPTLFGKHTTTYTFTKSLAEKLLHLEDGKLPTCIIRPSMSKDIKSNILVDF
jgi:hypothetical protein